MAHHLDILRRHLERTETHHLRPLILDIISVFEDRENNAVRLVREEFEVFSDYIQRLVIEAIREGTQNMSAALKTLQDAVGGLASGIVAHDQVVQTAVAALKNAAANGDQQGILDAAAAISAASAKLSGETTAITDAMGAANAASNGNQAPATGPTLVVGPDAGAPLADKPVPAVDPVTGKPVVEEPTEENTKPSSPAA